MSQLETKCNLETRLDWVDICKGIGVVLVVMGHTLHKEFIHRLIFLFHMPLFFFISGYLHRVRKDFGGFFYKKSQHLLLPYASFLLLFCPIEYYHINRHDVSTHVIKEFVARIMWGGNRMNGIYTVFWFIICLFLTQQIVNLLLVRLRTQLVVAFAIIAFVLGYINSIYYPWIMLPLDINVTLAAIPFFLAGHYWQRYSLKSWWIESIAALGIVFAVWCLSAQYRIGYDMKSGNYGTPVVSFVLALCCIAWTVRLGVLLEAVSPVKKIFTSLGAASLGIMFIHPCVPYIPGVARLAGLSSYAGFLISLLLSCVFTWLLMQFVLTRALFLGNGKDLIALKNTLSSYVGFWRNSSRIEVEGAK